MKIKRLEIENYRGIKNLAIDFAQQTNVFIGDNGAGKSAILDCLSVLLSKFTQQLTGSGERKFSRSDITNNETSAKGTIVISHGGNDSSLSYFIIQDKEVPGPGAEDANLKAFISKAFISKDNNFPLCLYYPVHRIILKVPLESQRILFGDQHLAYENSLNLLEVDFKEFFIWFRNREDLESETMRDDRNYRDKQLEVIKTAIESFLPGYSNLQVKRQPQPRMVLLKGNEELRIDQLSDGEKNLIAMIGDLARRLAIANPSLENPLEGDGIVMIDEIELHLHPKWQRMIVPAFERTFPNCQFILTTHSPQVLSDVKPENVLKLTRTGDTVEVSKPEGYFGRDTNSILEEIMDVSDRPEEIKKQLSEMFLMIAKRDFSKAREMMTQLKSEIGNDPEFSKAETLLHLKAK